MVRTKAASRRKPLRRGYTSISKSRRSKRVGKMMKKVIRRIAKGEVHKMVEDKELVTPVVGDTPGGSPGTFGNTNFETNNIIDVTDETLTKITQANGLTQNGRIGNRLRLRSCVLRGTLFPNAEQNMATYVKIWVVSARDRPNDASLANIRSICGASFFKTSPGTPNGSMTGQLIDLCRTVNEDQLQLYTTRVFKLGFQTSPNTVIGVAANNDFKLSHMFKIYLGRHMNKNVIYNDVTAEPRNKKIFVVMECIPADGSVSNNNSYAVLNYFLDIKYEDA